MNIVDEAVASMARASAEIERLRAVNAKLVAALNEIERLTDSMFYSTTFEAIRAAIAKARETT